MNFFGSFNVFCFLAVMVSTGQGLTWSLGLKAKALPKTVAITGSTGLVGSALTERLLAKGHSVRRLTTGKVPKETKGRLNEVWYKWDPSRGSLDASAFAGCDAVVHLAGENIASGSWDNPPFSLLGAWSELKKGRIMSSRVQGTRCVVDTLNKMDRPPRVLVSASAVGYYGFSKVSSTRTFSEEFGQGDGFLAEVAREWEREALKCRVRTVCARFGVVLSAKGGVLGKLLPLFKLAAGGNLGSGQQGFSWVSIDDAVSAIEFAIDNNSLRGPVNVCSPEPADNAAFTRALAKAVNRPAIVPLPEFVGSFLFGQFGDEVLFGGQKAKPAKLLSAGFKFDQPELESSISKQLEK